MCLLCTQSVPHKRARDTVFLFLSAAGRSIFLQRLLNRYTATSIFSSIARLNSVSHSRSMCDPSYFYYSFLYKLSLAELLNSWTVFNLNFYLLRMLKCARVNVHCCGFINSPPGGFATTASALDWITLSTLDWIVVLVEYFENTKTIAEFTC